MNAEWGTFGASSFAPAGTFPLAPVVSHGASSPAYVPPGFTPGGVIPGGTPVYPMPVFPTPPGGGYLPGGGTTTLPPPGQPLPPPVETLGPHWSETMFAPPIPGQLDPRQVEAMARHQQAAMQAGQGWGWKGMVAGLAGILLLIGLGYGAWRYTRRKVE